MNKVTVFPSEAFPNEKPASPKESIDIFYRILVLNFWYLLQMNNQATSVPEQITMHVPYLDPNKEPFILSMNNINSTVISSTHQNTFVTALNACFIACNSGLEKTFGKSKKIGNPSNNIEALRAVIFSIRCAPAHDFATPQWFITDPYYKKSWDILLVNGDKITVDLSDKDGTYVHTDHFGGLANTLLLFETVKSVL